MKLNKLGAFAIGTLFGTAGIKALSSKDAKKVYVHTTAAALLAKESVMTTVTTVRENAAWRSDLNNGHHTSCIRHRPGSMF